MEPKYQINLGYIARVSMNFGAERLFFVSPRAKLSGREAVKYAKHARALLDSAVVYRTLKDAVRDCDIVIGTTGLWRKAGVNFGNAYSLDGALRRVSKIGKDKKAALLVGRDDIGLKTDEIEMCDIVAHIETNPDYPVLNISHALAVMLYALTKGNFALENRRESVDRHEYDALLTLIERMIKKKQNIRNKKAVMSAFRRMLALSQPSRQEIHALMTALG